MSQPRAAYEHQGWAIRAWKHVSLQCFASKNVVQMGLKLLHSSCQPVRLVTAEMQLPG